MNVKLPLIESLPASDAMVDARQAIQAPIPDGLMDTPAAAAYLGLKPLSLVDFRTRRIGPVYCKLIGAVRYLRSDLDAWIQSCRKVA
jgi:predicted DNA-binding transcriptional regulator AlpA